MKLEEGMYVRTEKGKIRKIISLSFDKSWKSVFVETHTWLKEEHIKKASHNIIDLVENKDLCEIEFYSLRYNERVTRLFEVEIITDTYINFKNARCEFLLINKQWNSEDLELKPIIKTILTKEQFEKRCYRIGE